MVSFRFSVVNGVAGCRARLRFWTRSGLGVSRGVGWIRSCKFRVLSFERRTLSRCRDRFGFGLRAGGEEINFQGLAGVGQGLEGIGQEAVLQVPLGRSHKTIEHFGVQRHSHFVHEADNSGEFPAGLEEQFEIFAGLGAPDDTQDQFHDDIELAEQALVQVLLKPVHGRNHFLLEVLLVVLQVRDAEAVLFVEGGQGGAAEEGAIEVFDLVIATDRAWHMGLLRFVVKGWFPVIISLKIATG